MTTAYFTFDRDLLNAEVESFYWDPEIGVDFLAEDLEGEDSGEGSGEGSGEESPDGKKSCDVLGNSQGSLRTFK